MGVHIRNAPAAGIFIRPKFHLSYCSFPQFPLYYKQNGLDNQP